MYPVLNACNASKSETPEPEHASMRGNRWEDDPGSPNTGEPPSPVDDPPTPGEDEAEVAVEAKQKKLAARKKTIDAAPSASNNFTVKQVQTVILVRAWSDVTEMKEMALAQQQNRVLDLFKVHVNAFVAAREPVSAGQPPRQPVYEKLWDWAHDYLDEHAIDSFTKDSNGTFCGATQGRMMFVSIYSACRLRSALFCPGSVRVPVKLRRQGPRGRKECYSMMRGLC